MLELPHWRLLLCTALHGVLGYCSFYYMTVLNPMEDWIKTFAFNSVLQHYGISLNQSQLTWLWSITSGAYIIGCVVGAATLNLPTGRWGRRNTLMIVRNMLVVCSGVMQGLSKPLTSIELLILGRFLSGVAIMQSLSVHVFVSECSPTQHRGFISTLPALGQRFWTLAGALLALPMCGASEDNWNLVLVYPILPSVIHLLMTPFVPKSPKHLFISEKNHVEAKKSILFYHGPKANIDKIEEELRQEASSSELSVNLCEILSTKHLRWPMLLCADSLLLIPLGCVNIATLYSTGVMQSLGVPAHQAPIYTVFIIQLPGILASIISISLIERIGRRPLLLLGSGMTVLGSACLSSTTPVGLLSPKVANGLSVLSLALIYIGFSIGPSLIPPLLPGELAPHSSRSTTLSFSGVCDWSLAIVNVFCFPSLNMMIGSYAVLPLAVLGGMGWLFLFCFLPETKGRSVQQVGETWKPGSKGAI